MTLLNVSASSVSSKVTFKGGLSAPFHRWFRLTPSFSPDLVNRWLDDHSKTLRPLLLDPFSGAGTTAIVAKSWGVDAIALEINPFLAFVGQTCTNWQCDADELEEVGREVLSLAATYIEQGSSDIEEFSQEIQVPIPPIHNVNRWWRHDVLRQLLALKKAISSQDAKFQPYLTLSLAEIVYASANITLGRLQIAFVDRSDQPIYVFEPFEEVLGRVVEDLRAVNGLTPASSTVLEGDSTRLEQIEEGSIGGVFTSPPYPNRYSYVWNTRPHLYLLDFFTTPREAAALDVRTIGGTWGTATSMHQKSVHELRPFVEKAAGDVISQLHDKSLLMGNYVSKYFNDLDLHLDSLKPKLIPGSPVGYVVGNSETKGIMVETHDILADLMRQHGFGSLKQEVLRKRNSGAGLTEVTVSARF